MKSSSWKITLNGVVCGVCIIVVWIEALRSMPNDQSPTVIGGAAEWRRSSGSLTPDAGKLALGSNLPPGGAVPVPRAAAGFHPEVGPVVVGQRPSKRTKADGFRQISNEAAIALNAAACIFIALHNLPQRDPSVSHDEGISPFAVFSVPLAM